ncbi:hypothetical protein [Streptomyces sp. NPDC005336]|uniref:hypothetical protein n=1 Tax=Streptomyces sp. NPDC005336 TaxID=3157035 RepID=UPI0033AE218F
MRRRATSALAAAAAAALLLAGCGGGDDKKGDDKIAGAKKGDKSPSASQSRTSSAEEKGPKMTFPKDLEIDFESWKTSGGAEQTAALDGAANFVRSIAHGVVKQDPKDSAYLYYSVPLQGAQAYAKDQIKQYIDGGWTMTGKDRYYRPAVRMADDGKRASVTFCNDQGEMFGKEVKTKKILRTEASDKSYSFYEVVMKRLPKGGGPWQAESIEVKGKATQCKE